MLLHVFGGGGGGIGRRFDKGDGREDYDFFVITSCLELKSASQAIEGWSF